MGGLIFIIAIYYYTVDMSRSDVHLCVKSPILMRMVFGIGTASIHSPSRLCTCNMHSFTSFNTRTAKRTSKVKLEICNHNTQRHQYY